MSPQAQYCSGGSTSAAPPTPETSEIVPEQHRFPRRSIPAVKQPRLQLRYTCTTSLSRNTDDAHVARATVRVEVGPTRGPPCETRRATPKHAL